MTTVGYGATLYHGAVFTTGFNYHGEGVTIDVWYGAVTYSASVGDGNWHFYTWVVPEGTRIVADVKVYMDGVRLTAVRSSYSPWQTLNTASVGPLDIGTNSFDGALDEVRVYNRALSDAEIVELYAYSPHANSAPAANAGPDQMVEQAGPGGTQVQLNGSGSSDPDGDSLTYTWIWASQTASGVAPTVILPPGLTMITLMVSDGELTATDAVNITVQDTVPPATVISLSGTSGNNGWYKSDVDATITADPGRGSPIKEVHYILNGTESIVAGAAAQFTIITEGTSNLEYWGIDNAGNAENHKTTTVKIDKTGPAIGCALPDTGQGCGMYFLNETAPEASWSAADPHSGVVPPDTGALAIDTSAVGAGKVLPVPAGLAMDNAGNASEATTATYAVRYRYDGVLQPINTDGSSIFKLKSTVPVKFRLADAASNAVSTAVARIVITKIDNGILGDEMEAVSTLAATGGNLFRYDPVEGLYIFNLSTKNLSTGTWQIKIVLDDGTSQSVIIGLR